MTDHPHQWYGGQSYAQHGDDFALLNIFHRLGIEKGRYIDIGAHHPFDISNTALLYQRGWRGVCVEANRAAIPLFYEHRPEDQIICACAVGEHRPNNTVEFYRDDPMCGLNSMNSNNLFQVSDVVLMPTITLEEIVRNYTGGHWPDLLSIDAEGEDLAILRSIDAPHVPVIIVEAKSMHDDITNDIHEWCFDIGYHLHSWCGHNMILLQSDFMVKVL